MAVVYYEYKYIIRGHKMLNNINTLKKTRGFTIVELLIVIVVIAILAAITIVAYNGIQNRAKTSSGQAAASNVQKKVESYNAAVGSYPTGAADGNAFEALLNGQTESNIGSIQIAVPTSATGQNTVQVQYCTAGATGVRLAWFDYAANAVVADASKIVVLFSGSSCTTWGTALA
jgi:prepilin-type N-terminal cleavage/methylation domain-containing protein